MKGFVIIAIAFFGYQQVGANVITANLYNSNVESTVTTDLCTSKVYCQGPLLDTVQRAKVLPDSKSFVDLVQRNPESVTLQNFEALLAATNNNPTRDQVIEFVNKNFDSEGELINWTPSDLQDNPEFLNKITDADDKELATKLYKIWPSLAKKTSESVTQNPGQHSLISLPNGFIIPGGRFKEIYYWDSYWIVKGLLITGMKDTAKGMLENLISLVKRFGFVPNGSRVYYLNRSQPPLLSLMVGLYITATGDKTFLTQNIDILEQELKWWLANRAVTVSKGIIKHQLIQYNVKSGTPRPESYYEDVQTCSSFENKEQCYRNLKSGAESGWDFSTRMLISKNGSTSQNLTDINVLNIVPVDLNAFLCGAFGELSRFYKLIGNIVKAAEYAIKEQKWKDAIKDIFYDETEGIWKDWDLERSRHREGFYPSNFAPLWTKSYNPLFRDSYGSRAADYFNANKINDYAGGIPTSTILSGQQWDLPNAWPPLQEIIILGMEYTGNKKAKIISDLWAKRTIRAFMTGMNSTNEMFEKYDAINVGQFGGGGEYTVQSGFGWTNGVAFSMLQKIYGS